MSKKDTVPTGDPTNGAPTCITCRSFRVPDWVVDTARARMGVVARFAQCARWQERLDIGAALVVGLNQSRAALVTCENARSYPEMCGPAGRNWEKQT